MEITCYRDAEISREPRQLPANTYNLAVTLLARCGDGHLFVPIRSMQYMAIFDADEFVFIDGQRKCWVDIAWQNFKRRDRAALDQPITYEVVCYRTGADEVMARLQVGLTLALRALADKTPHKGIAHILPFRWA